MIFLKTCGIALPLPLPVAAGQSIASLGVIMEEISLTQKFYEAKPLGVWGQLTPGPGFMAIMAAGHIVEAESEEGLAELVREHFARVAYTPGKLSLASRRSTLARPTIPAAPAPSPANQAPNLASRPAPEAPQSPPAAIAPAAQTEPKPADTLDAADALLRELAAFNGMAPIDPRDQR